MGMLIGARLLKCRSEAAAFFRIDEQIPNEFPFDLGKGVSRGLLTGAAAILGAELAAPLARALAAETAPGFSASHAAFTPEQRALVSAVSERIVPTTDTPGAIALLKHAAELATRLASAEALADVERDLGVALEARGDVQGARAARRRAVVLYERLGAKHAAQALAALIGDKT